MLDAAVLDAALLVPVEVVVAAEVDKFSGSDEGLACATGRTSDCVLTNPRDAEGRMGAVVCEPRCTVAVPSDGVRDDSYMLAQGGPCALETRCPPVVHAGMRALESPRGA